MNRDEKIKDLARQTKFKEKDILLFLSDSIIDIDSKEETLKFLEKLKHIWFSRKYAKRILSYFPKRVRKSLVNTCELSKAESYVYSRLTNADANARTLYKKLIAELNTFYKVKSSQAKKIIKKVAPLARSARYYKRKKSEK